MNLPQIRLQSQFIQHGIQIEKPVQEIEQPKADLSIQQPQAQVEIETTKGKLEVDTTEARAEYGMKSVFRSVEDAASQGFQDWLAGIERVAVQGDELMKIENGGNPIADQAEANAFPEAPDWNIGFIPSFGSVQMHYTPALVNINITAQKPIIDVQVNKSTHNYTPGKISGFIEKWNALKIDFTPGSNIDLKK